jgi:hypothetical protein
MWRAVCITKLGVKHTTLSRYCAIKKHIFLIGRQVVAGRVAMSVMEKYFVWRFYMMPSPDLRVGTATKEASCSAWRCMQGRDF